MLAEGDGGGFSWVSLRADERGAKEIDDTASLCGTEVILQVYGPAAWLGEKSSAGGADAKE